ncbi:MAG: hypothetical protein LWW93_15920 [Hyphomicrobiales bacterium]|nr:hypothetical protein [Hyphomicrobiales bacterium]
MRAVRPLSIPPTTVLLLVAVTSSALSQDAGNWLTQPAPGVPAGGGGAGSGSGGAASPVLGANGWTATPGPNGQTIYTKTPPGSTSSGGANPSGSGASVPGINGWTATPGPNGQTIYTKTPPSTGASNGSTAPSPSPPDAGSGSAGAGVPVPGANGWIATPGPNGQTIYTKTPPSSGASPTPATPTTTTPSSPTQEVEAGWVADKNGKIKVIYVKDAQGAVVGGREEYYDADGKLTDIRPFNGTGVASPSMLPTVDDFQGTYSGSISGGASGGISLYVTGAVVAGSIDGVYKGDHIHAQFSGSVDGQGAFASNADGKLTSTDPKTSKVSTYPFTGHVSGRLTPHVATGTWSGANTWGASSGSWRATK